MEENDKTINHTGGRDNQNDCNCNGNCCPTKKKNILSKIIFTVVLLAALGIILVKLFFQSTPVPAANHQVSRDPDSPVWCDSTDNKTCDTSRESSCCPKEK